MLVILQQENDIYKGLHYGFGLKNASVAVIEYVNSTIILSGSKIQKKTHYNSFYFSDAGIQMWRCCYNGEGETIPRLWFWMSQVLLWSEESITTQ